MGNSASVTTEIYDHDETDEFQPIGDLPVVIPEIINDNIEQDVNIEFNEFQNTKEIQNTIVTLDLLDFDNKFPCPICSFEGRNRQISIITLSDHIGMHKYEILLNKKLENTQDISNYNNGNNEGEAIKIAISESNSENKLKVNKLTQAPVIIRKRNSKCKKLKMQESDHIDLNDINCD